MGLIDKMSNLESLATAFIIMIGLIAAWTWGFYKRLKALDERVIAVTESLANLDVTDSEDSLK